MTSSLSLLLHHSQPRYKVHRKDSWYLLSPIVPEKVIHSCIEGLSEKRNKRISTLSTEAECPQSKHISIRNKEKLTNYEWIWQIWLPAQQLGHVTLCTLIFVRSCNKSPKRCYHACLPVSSIPEWAYCVKENSKGNVNIFSLLLQQGISLCTWFCECCRYKKMKNWLLNYYQPHWETSARSGSGTLAPYWYKSIKEAIARSDVRTKPLTFSQKWLLTQ